MKKIYTEIHPGTNAGECPLCNGTGKVLATGSTLEYGRSNGWYGYVKDEDGKEYCDCYNCGAQYMFSKPSGIVRLNKEGQPCAHKYKGWNAGRCYTKYLCEHCGDEYAIDSGD